MSSTTQGRTQGMTQGSTQGSTQTNTHTSAHNCSHDVDMATCNNFFLSKGYDIISDGDYKKRVNKSRERNEAWALDLQKDVHCINNIIKEITNEILFLKEIGKERLFSVCEHVITHVNPPCRTRTFWNVCVISGIHNKHCIDLTGNCKTDALMTVHIKFSHFLSMLWLVARFEHICKVLARKWLSKQQDANTVSIQELCHRYETETLYREQILQAFAYAYRHVKNSLQNFRQTPAYEFFVSGKSRN